MKKRKLEMGERGFVCPFFKLRQFLITLPSKWYFWPLVGGVLLIVIYIFYAAFAYTKAVPDLSQVEVGAHNYYDKLQEAYRAMMNQMNNYPAAVFFTGLFLILAILVIYLIRKKQFNLPLALVMILIMGISMRILYGVSTDAILERQHDVWHSRGYGHYGIIVHLYQTGELPPVTTLIVDGVVTPHIAGAYQLYHPKLFHYAAAYFMRFNRLFFGDNVWTLYQSIRILVMWTSVMTFLIGYRLIQRLNLSNFGKVIALLFLSFSPVFYRLSAMTNNDNFMVFFLTIAIYNTVNFYHKPSLVSGIGIALGIGLAMASKLSGGLIALLVAIVFVITLIKTFLKDKKQRNYRSTWRLLLTFGVFAVIVFPLGLYWPIYNLKHYHQEFTYVFQVTNPNLMIKDATFLQRFIFLPLDQFTKGIFVDLSWQNRVGDFNIYATMIKSSAFGEFSSKFFLLGYFLYLASIALFFFFFIVMLYLLVQGLIHKKWPRHFAFLFALGYVALSFVSYVYFNVKHPATCTMDFRYLAPAVLTVAILFGYGGTTLAQEEPSKRRKLHVQFATLLLFGFYSLFSIGYYIALLTI
ncbi:MAG: ArnT family glycosyltransferase [Bacilli bacterium]